MQPFVNSSRERRARLLPLSHQKVKPHIEDVEYYLRRLWICRQACVEKEDFLLIDDYDDISFFTF
jgi:hypothetical protein